MSWRPEARYYLADILYREGDTESAIDAFLELPEFHPTAPRVPDALYRVGTLHLELGSPDDAEEYFERVVNTWPDSGAAGPCQGRPSGSPLVGKTTAVRRGYSATTLSLRRRLTSPPPDSSHALPSVRFERKPGCGYAHQPRWPRGQTASGMHRMRVALYDVRIHRGAPYPGLKEGRGF